MQWLMHAQIPTVETKTCMSNYYRLFYVDIITYPDLKFNEDLAILSQ